jgi:hypothetical protein
MASKIKRIRRIADVPNDADVNSVAAAPQERLAEPEAVQYLRKEVFPTGEISLSALRAPNSEATRTQSEGATEGYHGLLLKIENNVFKC